MGTRSKEERLSSSLGLQMPFHTPPPSGKHHCDFAFFASVSLSNPLPTTNPAPFYPGLLVQKKTLTYFSMGDAPHPADPLTPPSFLSHTQVLEQDSQLPTGSRRAQQAGRNNSSQCHLRIHVSFKNVTWFSLFSPGHWSKCSYNHYHF